MKEIVIYVHGKGGSAAEAGHYRPLFPDAEVVGFDYRAQSPWEAEAEFPPFFAAQRKRCDRLTLIANSIGAFFPCPRWMQRWSTGRIGSLPWSIWRS